MWLCEETNLVQTVGYHFKKMQYRWTYMFYTMCTLTMTRVLAQTPHVCKAIDDCSCKFQDDGAVIDISSLGNKDGTARFADVQSQDGFLYSYNPCHPFNEGVCQNVAACKKDRVSRQTLAIGSADMPQFTYDEMTGDTVIGYTAGTMGELHSFVYLMCDNSDNPGPPQFFPNGTLDVPNLFIMTLFSVCACGNKCDANGIIRTSSNVAIGTWVLASCIGLFVLYCALGVAFQKGVKKASGREIIPNSKFWFGLPGNIRAGVMFLVRGCKHDTKYDAI